MCSIENMLLFHIIKLGSLGKIMDHQLVDETGISLDIIEKFLNSLVMADNIKLEGGIVELSPEQKFKLTFQAVRKGVDVERVSRLLTWEEFEDLGISILNNSGFEVKKHFRFKSPERRYEIDILASKSPLILSIDCKHWKRSWQRAATSKAAEAQIDRTKALIGLLPTLENRLEIKNWKRVKIAPLILILSIAPQKTFKKVPIVPIYNFRSFLTEILSYEDEIGFFEAKT
ncbi:MAG: hypothetical protein QG646_3988 [Euryarchaeota archaeon]|nr:hypothetical protein [Euryarchaeota archaeon]